MVHKGMFLFLISMNVRSFCRFGVYEQETIINRNPYTGATSIVQENEFDPMRVGGYGNGYGYRY
jgi:hypothetical protein